MEVKKSEEAPKQPKKGRPSRAASTEKEVGSIEITMDSEYFVVRIPRKLAAKSLLGELFN
jgi:hypothetical protein